MATKTDFTPSEWQALLKAPGWASIAVVAASPSGPVGVVKEMFAAGKVLAEATKGSQNSLVGALVADLKTSEGRQQAQPKEVSGKSLDEVRGLAVDALKQCPAINAEIRDQTIVYRNYFDIGIAVSGKKGLVVPVLRNAERMSFAEIEVAIGDFGQRAQANKLTLDELEGGTFTISNLGMVKQIDQFTAIINPPQVGILAVGAVKERPVVRGGGLHIRTTAHLTLSADHRIVDGMVSARFIEAFDAHLQAFKG